jgi:hypothetical protein
VETFQKIMERAYNALHVLYQYMWLQVCICIHRYFKLFKLPTQIMKSYTGGRGGGLRDGKIYTYMHTYIHIQAGESGREVALLDGNYGTGMKH